MNACKRGPPGQYLSEGHLQRARDSATILAGHAVRPGEVAVGYLSLLPSVGYTCRWALNVSSEGRTRAREVTLDAASKVITLGHPSYIWGFGQERRLNIVRRYVALENRRILDIGCGIGAYVEAFRRFSPFVWGVDVDDAKIAEASATLPDLSVAPAESLPYDDNYFDIAFLHEVIEHVTDDRRAIAEACRVVAPEGRIIIFAPNRLYPFETHGCYIGKRHVYKLIPFVNYLPNPLRRQFCPHVRCYTAGDIRGLFRGQNVAFDVETQVYPAFDNIARGSAGVAGVLRRVLYALEETPLKAFGLSHFIVARKLR